MTHEQVLEMREQIIKRYKQQCAALAHDCKCYTCRHFNPQSGCVKSNSPLIPVDLDKEIQDGK